MIRHGESVRGLRYRRGGKEGELRAWCVAGADGLRSAVRRELGSPLRSWGHVQRYVVGIGPRPAELEDGAALIYHGTGYADGVMPVPQSAYFYDNVTPGNRAAVDAGDLDGWRATYAILPFTAHIRCGTAEFRSSGAAARRAARTAGRPLLSYP